jgi:hypothetical protein
LDKVLATGYSVRFLRNDLAAYGQPTIVWWRGGLIVAVGVKCRNKSESWMPCCFYHTTDRPPQTHKPSAIAKHSPCEIACIPTKQQGTKIMIIREIGRKERFAIAFSNINEITSKFSNNSYKGRLL